MTMFTQGQKMRMLAALNGPRISLLTSNTCSATTAIDELSTSGTLFKIYPSPTDQFLNVDITDKFSNELLNLTIINSIGKKQLSFSIRKSKTIDVSRLSIGIYYIICEEYPHCIQKFVITK